MDRRRRYEDDSTDDSDGENPAKRFHANGVPPDSPASPTPSATDEEEGAVICVNIPLTRTHSPETSGVGESEAVEATGSGRGDAEVDPPTATTEAHNEVEQPDVNTGRESPVEVSLEHHPGKEVGEQGENDDDDT